MTTHPVLGIPRVFAALSIVVFVMTAGCAGASTSTATAEHLLDGGACATTVEAVQGRALSLPPGPACPARFDDVVPQGRCGSFTDYRSGPCGGTLVYAGGCGMDQFVCVYDATSHELVGAATSTDTNAFCAGKSSCLTGGLLPPEIICETYGLITSACELAPLVDDGGVPDAASATGG